MKKYILLMLISANVYADADTNCLAQTIYHEIRGGSLKSKQAVGLVVLNRKKAKKTSICKVVKERGQFDFTKKKSPLSKKTKNWSIDKKSKDWKDVVLFTKDFLQNTPQDFTGGSTLFHNKHVHPNWDRTKIRKTIKIDDHIFYKERV